jgi:ribulose-phosphate 3-epimerase
MRCQVQLLPSILSADFCRLGDEVEQVMDGGARIIHVDVMDGHFVPNITVGPLVVQALAPLVHGRSGYFSVHLMIERPQDYVEAFVNAGADAVSVHAEASSHLRSLLEKVSALGASPGVALNPGSDLSRVLEVADLVDFVLVMTVNPGFGGQRLIGSALERVGSLRSALRADVAIEVDGGVNRHNIHEVVETGGNWVVTGSALFGATNLTAESRALRRLMAGESIV